MSFFSKIIAAIMSFLMLLFPGLGPEEPEKPKMPDPIRIVALADIEGEGNFTEGIISTYADWKASIFGSQDDIYSEEFFNSNSLAVFVVTRPDSGTDVEIESVVENGNTVTVTYNLVSKDFGATMICYSVVFATVSKNITTLSQVEI